MKTAILANQKIILSLLFLFLAGLSLRLFGINWDKGFYLNPDERFLAMTIMDLELPHSFWQYLNPTTSTLNPFNQGVNFFVYGTFPLTVAKFLAVNLGFDDYSRFYLLARTLSALVDASVIIAVFFITKELFRNARAAIFSALLYTIAVFPIQQAHFFTVDSFANAFVAFSLFFILKFRQQFYFLILSACFLALGLASKITAIYILPLLLSIILINKHKSLFSIFVQLSVFFLAFYITLRLSYPYLFLDANWFNILPNLDFVNSLKQLKILSKISYYPPSIQWYSKSILFPFKNLALFGIGPSILTLSVISLLFIKTKVVKTRLKITLLILWSLLLYVFLSLQFAKTMRYFLYLYPPIAVFAGYSLFKLNKFWRLIFILPALVWTVSFMHIYQVPHTRVQASYWLNQILPKGSVIVWEYWDDPLPLFNQKQFKMIKLEVFEPDTHQKWQIINKKLHLADYLVLSSNRAWGSILNAPELYPQTSRFYQRLFRQKLGYTQIKQFNSFPTLNLGFFKIQFNDSLAEEAFTVYDHPQVMIFKNTGFNLKTK